MKTIKELLPQRAHKKGDIGIEVEVEGLHLPRNDIKHWRVEDDHSLKGRENAEYVLSKPLYYNKVEDGLQSLTEALKDSQIDSSVRAGVHVHINVQDLNLRELANFVTMYLVVEDLLLDVCGEGRQSNLFCLKACEAEYWVKRVGDFFRHGHIEELNTDSIRYSSMNLAALPKYGSVEFRAMRTPQNIMDIKPWVDTIYHMKELSRGYEDATKIIEYYSSCDLADLVKRYVGESYSKQLLALPNWMDKLKRGMRTAQDLLLSRTDWSFDVKEVEPADDKEAEIRERIRGLNRDIPEELIQQYLQLRG